MHSFKATLAAGALVLGASAGAVVLQGPGPGAAPTAGAASTEVIERGGTVMQVNMTKRELVIDGVPWTISPATRILFPAPKKGALQAAELRPGDQVKFSTRKMGSSEDVLEILVVGRDTRFDRR